MLKIAMLGLALAGLLDWDQPTETDVLEGELAFSYRIESAAQVKGITLTDPGIALMRKGDLGRTVHLFVNGAWIGPLTVVDCSQESHYEMNVGRERIGDISWDLWSELGLPLMPVEAEVWFDHTPPWARPEFEPEP